MAATFICPCGDDITLPDPEPAGSYDKVCPGCGAIWQFLNFQPVRLLEPKVSAGRFQVMLHYSGKHVSITLEDQQEKTSSVVYRREI